MSTLSLGARWCGSVVGRVAGGGGAWRRSLRSNISSATTTADSTPRAAMAMAASTVLPESDHASNTVTRGSHSTITRARATPVVANTLLQPGVCEVGWGEER